MWMHIPLLITLTASVTAGSDTTTVKAKLIAADMALSRQASRSGQEVVLAALDPGAAVLFPGQPVLRAAESRAPFMARYEKPSTFSWRPVHAVASTDGLFGCTFGYSSFFNAADTLKTPHKGTYLTCWKKEKNGKWRIVATQRNDSPGQDPAYADGGTLPGAPHSATVSLRGNPATDARDADSVFAVLGEQPAGPGPAFVRYAAEDGMLVGSGEFPRGKEGMEKAFEGFPAADRAITWRPLSGFGAGSGGLAYTVGHSVSGPRPGKTGRSVNQKYMTVWRQEPDGRWLYIFDLGTPR